MDLCQREVAEDEAERCGFLRLLDLAICAAGVRTFVVAVLDDQRPADAAEVIELIDLEHVPDDVTRLQRALLRAAGPGLLQSRHHPTFIPPSTTMSTPVTYELSCEARNSATFATSSGRPR